MPSCGRRRRTGTRLPRRTTREQPFITPARRPLPGGRFGGKKDLHSVFAASLGKLWKFGDDSGIMVGGQHPRKEKRRKHRPPAARCSHRSWACRQSRYGYKHVLLPTHVAGMFVHIYQCEQTYEVRLAYRQAELLASLPGFEPGAFRLGGGPSILLRYRDGYKGALPAPMCCCLYYNGYPLKMQGQLCANFTDRPGNLVREPLCVLYSFF